MFEENTTAESIGEAEVSADWYEEPSDHADQRDSGPWDERDTPDNPKTPETDTAGEERFTLKHLGQEFDVSREELITLAQKGTDYDRIRARADALSASHAAGASDEYRSRRDHELMEFISEYGEISPEEIPPEVWREVAGGKPLITAFQGYENRILKAKILADIQNQENRLRSTGSRSTAGKAQERGELESDWYSD